jgi:hypothetical protein
VRERLETRERVWFAVSASLKPVPWRVVLGLSSVYRWEFLPVSFLAAFSLGGDGLELPSSLAVLVLVCDLEVGFSASFLSGLEIGSAREDAVLERVAFGMFVDKFRGRRG